METTEYTAIIRSMIQHEDSLRDQRLGWLFALNGFIVVLSMVGVLVAVSSAVALTGNQRAIAKLADLGLAQTEQTDVVLPPVIALRSTEVRRKFDESVGYHLALPVEDAAVGARAGVAADSRRTRAEHVTVVP